MKAYCSCGWIGKDANGQTEAENDGCDHMVAAYRGEPNAPSGTHRTTVQVALDDDEDEGDDPSISLGGRDRL